MNWTDEKNARRCWLIDKQIERTITKEERAELETLQTQAMEYRESVAPLPLETLREISRKMNLMKPKSILEAAAAIPMKRKRKSKDNLSVEDRMDLAIHYQQIAAVLAHVRQRAGTNVHTWDCIQLIEDDLVTMFKQDNPRFEKGRFFAASDRYGKPPF